jgi:hypothetical protein
MTTTATKIRTALAAVGIHEEMKKTGLQKFPEAASPGEAYRQGDIYIMLLDGTGLQSRIGKNRGGKALYQEVMSIEPHHLQLAEGETMGSRHILRTSKGVRLYTPIRENFDDAIEGMMAGPVLCLAETNVIDHPEHAPVELPKGDYVIIYQRTTDLDNRIRRVVD